MNGIGKRPCATALTVLTLLAPASAGAQVANFAGPWSVSGQIVNGNMFLSVAPVCTFTQVGNQLTGICRGPNGIGPATGLASGFSISWQWQITPTTPIGIGGIASFQGRLGPDNVIRGSWSSSVRPYARGPFTALRP